MRRLFSALLLVVATTLSASAQSLPVPSYWLNQRGSEMKLYSVDAGGNFKGVYINHAAGFQCQNTPYDLWGHSVGNRVKFKVVWQNWAADCHSKTIWRGRLIGPTLATWWLLVVYNPDGSVSKLRGTDVFHLQP